MEAAKDENQSWMRGDTDLKGAILTLLDQRPTHVYALARILNRLLGPAANIQPKSLYPRLAQLERAGLVASPTSKDIEWDRRKFVTTRKAASAIEAWMGQAAAHPPIRHSLQMKIVVSKPRDVPMLLQLLEAYELSCLDLLRSNVGEDIGKVSWAGVIMNIARAGTTAQIKAELDWVRAARRELQEAAADYPAI